MANLAETKGYANFKGTISGLHSRKGDGSSFTSNDYVNKLQFFINTSEHNSIPVSVTQFKSRIGKKVYASKTTEDGKYTTKAFDWSKRNSLPKDYQLFGVRCRAEGEQEVRNLVEDDAIEYILNNFKDGDVVFINAKIDRTESGKKQYVNYNISSIYSAKEIKEDDAEIADFQEEFVYTGCIDSDPFMVKGLTISFGDKTAEVVYDIENESEADAKLIDYIKHNINFGDVVTAEGIVHNRVIGRFVEDEKEVIGRATTFSKPSRTFVVDGTKKGFQILAISDINAGIYDKSDFEPDAIEDNNTDFAPESTESPANDDIPGWLQG